MYDNLEWVDTAAGSISSRNRPKRMRAAMLEGFASREQYASYFMFDEGFPAFVAQAGSCKGFEATHAVHFARWCPIDIDRYDEDKKPSPEQAQAFARDFVRFLEVEHEVDPRHLIVYFSGSKGFHILIPSVLMGVEPSPILNKVFREFALRLAPGKIDPRIYDLTRLFRIPNSQHAGSGLYKIQVSAQELLELPISAIQSMATGPRSPTREGEFHTPPDAPNAGLAALYQECMAKVEADEERAALRASQQVAGANEGGRLDRASLEDIADLVGPKWTKGQRHNICMALVGYVATHGIPREEAAKMVDFLIGRTGDDDAADRMTIVANTYDLVDRGQAPQGYRGLEPFFNTVELRVLEGAITKHAAGKIRPAASTSFTAPTSPSTPGSPADSTPENTPLVHAAAADPDDWNFIDFGDLPTLEAPPTIIKDLIPGMARIVVSGNPKEARKTWYCLQMALCVHHGMPFLGMDVIKQGRVSYYSGEEPAFLVQQRLRMLATGLGLDPCGVLIPDPNRPLRVRFDIPKHIDLLRRHIDRHKPVMVIFEPLAHLHACDENKAKEIVEGLLEPLTNVVLETGVTLVLAHHANKAGITGGGGANMRGSSAIWGWYDAGLHAEKKGDYVRMNVEQRRLAGRDDLCYELHVGKCTDAVTDYARLELRAQDLEMEKKYDRARKGGGGSRAGGGGKAAAAGGGDAPAGPETTITPSNVQAWAAGAKQVIDRIQLRGGCTRTDLRGCGVSNTRLPALLDWMTKNGYIELGGASVKGGAQRLVMTGDGTLWAKLPVEQGVAAFKAALANGTSG